MTCWIKCTDIFSLFFSRYKIRLPRWLSGKNLLAVQEMQVQFLGWEDPMEKEMAIHSSILAWETLWTEELGGLQSLGSQKSWTQLSD